MAGRPRKPIATKDLEGNRGKRDLPKPLPLHGLPEFPDGLNEEGEKFWRLVAGELGAVGVAKRIDGPVLEAAAIMWEWVQYSHQHSDLDALCKAMGKWLSLAGKLGLTPADRERLTIAATEPVSEEDQFFRTVG